jgi:Arc/MetJ-type ribon-helix-helix transcriptional regulator
MNLTLDPATEQRIQREIDLGHYRDPAEVIARAVALLEAEQEWLLRNKEAINQRLDESFAQVERGEVHAPEEARRILEQDRQTRIAAK